MATSRFLSSIYANLGYWQSRVAEIDDPALRELIPEIQNLYRALEFGLAVSETWQSAAELTLDLNYLIEHSGNWQPWQLLLQRALSWCGDDDDYLKLRLLGCSGQYYRRDRDWGASLAAHRQEELLARKLGKKDGLAQAHLNIGKVHWRRREYESAAKYTQLALSGFQAVGATERQMGGVHTDLGLIEYGRGNFAAAIASHTRAAEHFRKTDFLVLFARSLVNLALAQEADGDAKSAMASYLKAHSILEATSYEMDKMRLELSLGSLLFNTERFSEAEEAFLRAYSPYLKRSGLIYFQGLATNNLGNVYLEQGRLGEAEAILRDSLALWERANAPLQIANTTGTLAKVLAIQGRIPEAMTCFERAIAGAEAYADDGWAKQILEEFKKERAELLG